MNLGRSEAVVLGILAKRLQGAHGAALLPEISTVTGREWSVGALYTTLDRLEKKGFIASHWGEPTPQRGGRRKRIFRVVGAGQHALFDLRQLMNTVTSVPGELKPVEA